MTRTERASYPRAVLKDRSEARNGMDRSLKKGGAAGGWGTIQDEIAGGQSPEMPRRASITMTDEERRDARDFRASAFKNGGMSRKYASGEHNDEALHFRNRSGGYRTHLERRVGLSLSPFPARALQPQPLMGMPPISSTRLAYPHLQP
ncbi:hypothetical protein FRC11_005340 [Ceratobasidium sp. 423]|nr:hypothetical protein FRC11_005340 [Ceratobasidium sp. 423]